MKFSDFDINEYKGRRVLVTGHTGFKGTWLCRILLNAGALVCGYALEPTSSFYEKAGIDKFSNMHSVIGDIRDFEKLLSTFRDFSPEFVFHLAAQPIVRTSYSKPRYTYETNVMGTVNVMECVRLTNSVRSVLNITTDKVYKNNEWEWGYKETDPLDGFDPYSNSKSCSELVTHCYKNSFFSSFDGRNSDRYLAVSTARAGNVIGGGDDSVDRIIPDCIRAVESKQTIIVRNPNSTRPYQHVLEPLMAYLMIANQQSICLEKQGYYNVGPRDEDCVTTGQLVTLFCNDWGESAGWISQSENGPHEAGFLKLDCSLIREVFSWKPVWTIEEAVSQTVRFAKEEKEDNSISKEMDREILLYIKSIYD